MCQTREAPENKFSPVSSICYSPVPGEKKAGQKPSLYLCKKKLHLLVKYYTLLRKNR
jgi:hypothetical protein